jgi:hypothetical protein
MPPALAVAGFASALAVLAVHEGSRKGVTVLVTVAGALWLASTRNTLRALALLMLYLGLLDGYLKLSTGSNLVTLARDVLLFALVAGLLIRATAERRSMSLPPLSGWVAVFVLLVMVQLLNPLNGTLLHSIGGLRQNLEFVPLFFLTYAFVRTKKALLAFVILFAVIATANGAVNVVQSRESPQQLSSWGPGYAARVHGTGQFQMGGRTFFGANGQRVVRPFGLMSDAGTGGLVCAFSLGCILALGSLPGKRRYIPLALLAGVAAVAGVVTSQGRAVIICSFLVVLVYAALTMTSRRGLATVAGVAALCVLALVAVGVFVRGASTRYSGLTAGQIVQTTVKARGLALDSIPYNLINYPLGSGLGTGGPAAGQSGAPAASLTANSETEISFATLEAGIPGMLVIVGFTGALLIIGMRRCRLEPDQEARTLLAALVAPLAGVLALYLNTALTPTTPTGPYLWAVGGVIAYWLITRQGRSSTTRTQREVLDAAL